MAKTKSRAEHYKAGGVPAFLVDNAEAQARDTLKAADIVRALGGPTRAEARSAWDAIALLVAEHPHAGAILKGADPDPIRRNGLREVAFVGALEKLRHRANEQLAAERRTATAVLNKRRKRVR